VASFTILEVCFQLLAFVGGGIEFGIICIDFVLNHQLNCLIC
jgi:hypothetical protein